MSTFSARFPLFRCPDHQAGRGGYHGMSHAYVSTSHRSHRPLKPHDCGSDVFHSVAGTLRHFQLSWLADMPAECLGCPPSIKLRTFTAMIAEICGSSSTHDCARGLTPVHVSTLTHTVLAANRLSRFTVSMGGRFMECVMYHVFLS
jgi:hypothetical protein